MDIKLPEIIAKDKLMSYSGANNYIIGLRESITSGKINILTLEQSEYIISNFDTIPKIVRRWVDIDESYSSELLATKFLSKAPSSIWVEKLLLDGEKYHVWGKILETSALTSFWVNKSQLIPETKNDVVVDFNEFSHRPPFEHQKEAITKLVSNKKYILADDMGLGKTSSAIMATINLKLKKVLIVCPASLKVNWKREIENYSDSKVGIVEGKNWEDGKYVIINYDILKNFHSLPKDSDKRTTILDSKFDLVIIDEAHYISNGKAQRTKLVNNLTNKIGRLWLLSGTPMTSRPMNYYNLLKLVGSRVANNWISYVRRYCDGKQIFRGYRKIWLTFGATNLEELRDKTNDKVLRRLKEDVLDLPDKIITPIYMELKSKEYEEEVGEYKDWKRENKNKGLSIQLSKLMKVRQIIALAKISETSQLIDQCLQQDKKVIVFTNFTEPLMQLHEKYKKESVILNGTMKKEDRQKSVDRFQNDEKIKIFIGNVKAAGVGITLTSAEVVIFNDLSFVPSDMSQCEDRAFRIGQDKKVSCLYPIYQNTLEYKIYNIVKNKKSVIDTVMGDNIGDEDIMSEIVSML
ncbi:DEAD/DEAH box helicase [bacterium]|jgi:SWI/SNF-related matrix-associated actin-dependent regulator of chromatin subfamily A-like protein 1|nr:DEAD/DEAH box helicase [bacterium]|tara:strand:- start:1164 stop:2894 length:1731 start_codon:yes stop_codon:yes gene_type:complete